MGSRELINRKKPGESKKLVTSQSNNAAFARLIVLFGLIWAITGFGVLPLVIVVAGNQGWASLFKLVWLMLPAYILLTSLGYWLAEKRTGAIADAIVSCGVALAWLLVVILDLTGTDLDLGLLPYVLVLAVVVFTILSFWAFQHSVSEDQIIGPTFKFVYWVLFVVTTAVIAMAYGLVLYFQIIAA
jgi:hypothetical protein